MTTKAAEKIIDGLNQLMEGFFELRLSVKDDLGASGETEDEEAADPELDQEVEAAVGIEMRAALETVLENEELSSEDLALMISNLTEALEEVDPDVFAEEEEDQDEDDDEYEDDDDDDDYEYDEDEDEEEDDDEKEKEE